MAIRLAPSGGSNKLTSSTFKPTNWAFTLFLDVDIDGLGAGGSVLLRFEATGPTQRIGLQWSAAGAFQISKTDSVAATTTQTWFTDADLANNGRISIALVSDGTTAQGYYQRKNGDVVKVASLALGTFTGGPATTSLAGIFTAGGSDAPAKFYNFLVYDTNLGEDEIYWQLFAGLSPARPPIRMQTLIGWFPFRNAAACGANLASTTDLTLTGTCQDQVDDAQPARRVTRLRQLIDAFTGTASAALSAFAATASGTVTFTGTGSAAMQPFDANGAGTSGSSGVTGTGSAAMSSFAATSAGTETFTGTGSAAASPFAASGTGTESFVATAAAAMASFAVDAAGIVLGFIGTAVAAMASFGASSIGAETFTGSGSAGASPFGADGSGTVPVVAAPITSPWAKLMKPRYARWRRRRDGIV